MVFATIIEASSSFCRNKIIKKSLFYYDVISNTTIFASVNNNINN